MLRPTVLIRSASLSFSYRLGGRAAIRTALREENQGVDAPQPQRRVHSRQTLTKVVAKQHADNPHHREQPHGLLDRL
jgi:hypothetical protein